MVRGDRCLAVRVRRRVCASTLLTQPGAGHADGAASTTTLGSRRQPSSPEECSARVPRPSRFRIVAAFGSVPYRVGRSTNGGDPRTRPGHLQIGPSRGRRLEAGLGRRFDDERLEAYPPGAVVVLPGGTPHFHWAKSGAYVTQESAIGPLGLDYIDPADDPRNK